MTASKRIRYKLDDAGLVMTSPKFLGTGAKWLQVAINLKDNTFKVLDVETERAIANGEAKTRASVLKEVKVSLKTLGVNFFDEVRNSKNRAVPQV